ncbi:MAG: nitroreductase family protein [Bacteroides sp.]
MSLKDIVYKARTVRRFKESENIASSLLHELVDLARLAPCGANKQAIRYYLVTQPTMRARVYETLGWAAYLTEWKGPAEGERPAAYIIQVEQEGEGCLRPVDPGFAAQNILLGAAEQGLGSCLIDNVRREALAEILSLPQGWKVLYVIALGVPAETVEIRPVGSEHGIKYWREGTVHCVPKRTLEEIIYKEV